MKKKTPRRTAPDKKTSDRDVADFWDTHSVADYWDEMEPAELSIGRGPRRVVTLRLDPGAVEALRTIAKRRGMDYSALARSWISERLHAELRAAGMRKSR